MNIIDDTLVEAFSMFLEPARFINGKVTGNMLSHRSIAYHFVKRVRLDKIEIITYGGLEVLSPDVSLIEPFGVHSGEYAVFIVRPEPESSLLEIVKGFSSSVLGKGVLF